MPREHHTNNLDWQIGMRVPVSMKQRPPDLRIRIAPCGLQSVEHYTNTSADRAAAIGSAFITATPRRWTSASML
jgi:hypothetical protein